MVTSFFLKLADSSNPREWSSTRRSNWLQSWPVGELETRNKVVQKDRAKDCQTIEELRRICCEEADKARQLKIDELFFQQRENLSPVSQFSQIGNVSSRIESKVYLYRYTWMTWKWLEGSKIAVRIVEQVDETRWSWWTNFISWSPWMSSSTRCHKRQVYPDATSDDQLYCCNPDWMRNGGLTLWNVLAICDTLKILKYGPKWEKPLKIEKSYSGQSTHQNSTTLEGWEAFISVIGKMANFKKQSKMRGEGWKSQRMRQCRARKEQQRQFVASGNWSEKLWIPQSTRQRLESSHEDHIAGKGKNWCLIAIWFTNLFLMPQAMKIADAKAAVDKEWKKLKTNPAWQWDKVNRKKDVILEAQRDKK